MASHHIELRIAVIGGTGFSDFSLLKDQTEINLATPYSDTPVAVIQGTVEGIKCFLVSRHGKGHTVMPSLVNYRAILWSLNQLGVSHIMVTSACGSLREEIAPGDIVILDDFIDRTTKRAQTFYDPSVEGAPAGVCHPSVKDPYCELIRERFIAACIKRGYKERKPGDAVTTDDGNVYFHRKGVAVCIEGPRYSSKAESNMFRLLGGDVANMTTIPEVVLARELGICYASLALITDYDSWRDDKKAVSVPEVMATFKRCCDRVGNILKDTILNLAAEFKSNPGAWSTHIIEKQQASVDAVMLPGNYTK